MNKNNTNLIVENFRKFELKATELILGGELIPCLIISSNGSIYEDFYDTERDAIVFLPSQ